MKIRRRYRFANLLLDAARRLLPWERRDWTAAMRAEADHVPEDELLRWALGCFLAAIKQRFAPMPTGGHRVLGGSGLVRLTDSIIERNFRAVPGGSYILVEMFVNSVIGLPGPAGLFLGLRYVFTGRGLQKRIIGWTMAGILVVANLVGTIAGKFWGPPDFHAPMTFTFLFA